MAVDNDKIKFSDLYTIITGTTHTVESVSLSSFRGEGTVPTDTLAAIGIGLHFKGQTFSSLTNIYEYQSKTFQGNATGNSPASVFTGLSKTKITAEQYTETPISWNGDIEINASIVKNANCNDHFFILTHEPNKPSWSWGSTLNQYKIVWNCSNLTIYHPTGSVNTGSASSYPRTYELKIIKADNFIKVYLDNAVTPVLQCPTNGNLADTFKIWIGADADSASEAATFNNVSVEIFTLYDFTSHTFKNCGATGRYGPTLENCRTTYDDPTPISWISDTNYFNMTTQGIQEWTVPMNGTYKIEAWGASGGNDKNGLQHGFGAKIIGTFLLTKGEKYMILVGQKGLQGNYACGAGGGGSFVVKGTIHTSVVAPDILIIAGGGGGAGRSNTSEEINGRTGRDGGYSYNESNGKIMGGTDGGGGGADTGGDGSAGGGGFLQDGDRSYGSDAYKGKSFKNGGQGGTGASSGDGGFGGGGGAHGYWTGGGGGGGFSGGAGGSNYSAATTWSGGGGGSYNSGASQENVAGFNDGEGKVEITLL